MFRVFLRSVGLHFGWFFGAFSERGRAIAPLGFRRLFLLLVLFPLYCGAQGVHWLGFLLDEIFFRGYRRTAVERPIFITGIPRSGTTFVHRTLASDTERFSTLRTWEAVLAPSVTERRGWKWVGSIDRILGGWGKRMVAALVRRAEGDFADIHAVGLDAPEEDYLLLLPAGACFITVLAFPFSEEIWDLGRLDALPAKTRETVLVFYRRCLQKHLHVTGQGHRLLSKNAAFSSWIPELRRCFPGARFLVCVRDPEAALSSQLSSICGGFVAAGGRALETHLAPGFENLYAHAFAQIEKELAGASADVAVVDQAALKSAPDAALRAALAHLGETITPALEDALADAAETSRSFRSRHHHAVVKNSLLSEKARASLAKSYSAILTHWDRARKPQAGSSLPSETQ